VFIFLFLPETAGVGPATVPIKANRSASAQNDDVCSSDKEAATNKRFIFTIEDEQGGSRGSCSDDDNDDDESDNDIDRRKNVGTMDTEDNELDQKNHSATAGRKWSININANIDKWKSAVASLAERANSGRNKGVGIGGGGGAAYKMVPSTGAGADDEEEKEVVGGVELQQYSRSRQSQHNQLISEITPYDNYERQPSSSPTDSQY
jgi:hypothetical protein